jgi:tRNA (guanine37-N1)-methyltransferase
VTLLYYLLMVQTDQFEDKELDIANAILKMNRHVKSVCKKLGAHEGQFRVQKVKPIGGGRKTETIHSENGVRMRLDLGKSYYSPRMANDRLIIAKQVKPGEVLPSFLSKTKSNLIISLNYYVIFSLV